MSEKKEKPTIEPAKVPEVKTKVEQAASMFDELKAQGLKSKEAVLEIAKRLGVSPRSVRGYIWRAQNHEKFKAMLERYYAKKSAKAEEKKAKKESKA